MQKKKLKIMAAIIAMMLLVSAFALPSLALEPMAETNQYRMLFTSNVRSGKGVSYSSLGTASKGSLQLGINSSSIHI